MVLIGVKEERGWLNSRWNLTYPVGWEHICRAVHSVWDYYHGTEILVNGAQVNISSKDDILTLPENRSMVIRGASDIMKVPVMITFYNQLRDVDVSVAGMTEEFSRADYQKFNMSMGQFMDSIELAMYRK